MSEQEDPFLHMIEDDARSDGSSRVSAVLTHLPSNDVGSLELAKHIAESAFDHECRKGEVLEQRAFNLSQFAKLGLAVVGGLAGFISFRDTTDSKFLECLLLLLLIASIYLLKLFYRGKRVIFVGTLYKPHLSTQYRPDYLNVYATQVGEYPEVLRKHVARMILYFDNYANENAQRVYNCACCFVNTLGFLGSILLFGIVFFVHQLLHINLTPPFYLIIGALLAVFAAFTDIIWDHASGEEAIRTNEMKKRRY
jgi:hypothetical protein